MIVWRSLVSEVKLPSLSWSQMTPILKINSMVLADCNFHCVTSCQRKHGLCRPKQTLRGKVGSKFAHSNITILHSAVLSNFDIYFVKNIYISFGEKK